MNKNAKIIKTADGSTTLFLPDMNEHYHSIHGARKESEHVYIKKGVEHWFEQNPEKKKIRVLEIGFGTGVNALLTYNYAVKHNIEVEYKTLEPFPIDTEIVNQLDFNFEKDEKEMFLKLHQSQWEEKIIISSNFSFLKNKLKIEELDEKNQFDLVYFDAFAPNKQKNMWDSGNLLKMKTVIESDSGFLVTYCAQGQFKRDAKDVGFIVESTDGPPRKHEMVRLLKKIV